jgi:hypothetical protein
MKVQTIYDEIEVECLLEGVKEVSSKQASVNGYELIKGKSS